MFRWHKSLFVGLTLASLACTPLIASAAGPKTANPFAGAWYWGEPSGAAGWVEVSNGGRITGELYLDEFPKRMWLSGRIGNDGSFVMEFSYYSGTGGVTSRTKPIVFEQFGWAELDSFGNVLGTYLSDTGLPQGTFLWVPQ